jgi:hypothetical protein
LRLTFQPAESLRRGLGRTFDQIEPHAALRFGALKLAPMVASANGRARTAARRMLYSPISFELGSKARNVPFSMMNPAQLVPS